MALVPKTKRRPSLRLSITASPNFGFKMGFLEICDKAISAIKEKKKTRHIDQCTPIHPIENPAKAGPNTEANCQVVLLQVAAFGYTFFGTIKANQGKYGRPQKCPNDSPDEYEQINGI